MRSTSPVLTALAAAGLLFAACSDDADRAQPPVTTTSTTTAPPTTATVEEPEPVYSGADSEAICALAGDEVFLATFRDVRTGEEFRIAFEDTLDTLDGMAEVVPGELAPDLSAASEGFRAVRERLAGVDFDLLRIEPAMLDAPGMNRAFGRVDRYLAEVCRGERYEPPSAPALRSELEVLPAGEAASQP
jgi:hypothetical protein